MPIFWLKFLRKNSYLTRLIFPIILVYRRLIKYKMNLKTKLYRPNKNHMINQKNSTLTTHSLDNFLEIISAPLLIIAPIMLLVILSV